MRYGFVARGETRIAAGTMSVGQWPDLLAAERKVIENDAIFLGREVSDIGPNCVTLNGSLLTFLVPGIRC